MFAFLKYQLPILWLVMWLNILSGAFIAHAQKRPNSAFVSSQQSQWEWTQEELDGDDVPFKRLRAAIDAAITKGEKTEALINRYEKILKAKPTNPQASFAWAYAIYQNSIKTGVQDARLKNAYQRFAEFPSPRSYQYTRLHFLTAARIFPAPQLSKLGERLLKSDANDYDVNYFIIDTLNLSIPQEKELAFNCAQRLIQLAPNRPSAHASVGWVYFRAWLRSKNPNDGDKSIAAYQQYLKLTPPNDPFRSQAERLIKFIQGGLAQPKH